MHVIRSLVTAAVLLVALTSVHGANDRRVRRAQRRREMNSPTRRIARAQRRAMRESATTFVTCPDCQHVGRVADSAYFCCALCDRIGRTLDHLTPTTCSECPREPIYRLYDERDRFTARGDFRCAFHSNSYTMSYVTL